MWFFFLKERSYEHQAKRKKHRLQKRVLKSASEQCRGGTTPQLLHGRWLQHETALAAAIANLNLMRDHPDYNDQNLNDNETTERQSSSTQEPFHSSRSGKLRKVLSRLSTQVGKIGDCNDQNLNNKYARLRITIQSVRVVVCGEQPAAERFLFHSVREITERQTSVIELHISGSVTVNSQDSEIQ